MPRDLTTLFKNESIALEQGILYHLIEVTIPDQPALRIVDSNEDQVYNSITYSKFPVKVGELTQNSDGSITKASITVANVNRVISAYLENNNGLRNSRVKIITVYDKHLDNGSSPSSTSSITDEFIIDSYSANEQTVTFQLEPVVDFDIKIPHGRFVATSCRFRYKDPNTCAYVGILTTCKKDLADCRLHNNISRFGGAPGVGTTMRKLYF